MHRPNLTDTELLLLLDMCISAEQKCDARESAARAKGEIDKADYVVKLRRQYSMMKENLLSQVASSGTSTDDLHAQLQQISRHLDDTIPPLTPKPDLSASDSS